MKYIIGLQAAGKVAQSRFPGCRYAAPTIDKPKNWTVTERQSFKILFKFIKVRFSIHFHIDQIAYKHPACDAVTVD